MKTHEMIKVLYTFLNKCGCHCTLIASKQMVIKFLSKNMKRKKSFTNIHVKVR